MKKILKFSYKVLWVFSLTFLPNLSFAQVTYSSALNLAKTRASRIGYEVVNYKISNLNGTNKKLYWFMSVGESGGACLMSIPETALKIDYSKCVSSYEVSSLSEAYGEISAYFDSDEFQRQQEMEKKEQLAEEKRIADEARQRKLKSDRELPPFINKLESLLQSKDTVEMLRVYRDLENSNLINGNENGVNSKKLEKFLEIKIFVQNQQIEKERLEKERIRIQLESDRLEKERLEKELVRVLTSNTFKFKKFEMASAPFDSLMSWEVANKACSNLGDGWRLPTEKELDKIYNNRYKKNIYSTTLFYYWYWSSSKNSSGRFWATDFGRNYKDVYFGFFDSSMKNKVWAVRNLTN
jgi:hypothetical protein